MEHKILAVDDEPGILRLIEKMISEITSYDICSTSNALELPELLRKNRFDVILADLKMPGLGGIDILKLIKEENRQEKVIILTAFGSIETALEAISLGVYDYIMKPFKKEQIIHSVQNAVSKNNVKQNANRIMDILNTNPYDKTEKAFLEAYIMNMADKYDNNISKMTELSGLPDKIIKKYVNN